MTRALSEIEAAYRAGIQTVNELRRLMKSGEFPQPDKVIARRPVWSETTIERWLHGEVKRDGTQALDARISALSGQTR